MVSTKWIPGLMLVMGAAGFTPALALNSYFQPSTQHRTAVAQLAGALDNTESIQQLNSTRDLDTVLDLTPEQVEQLDGIFAEYQPRIQVTYGTYTEAAEVMVGLLQPETSDAALTEARETVLTTKRAVEDLIFERNLALRAVLDIEQRQVINTFLQEGLGL